MVCWFAGIFRARHFQKRPSNRAAVAIDYGLMGDALRAVDPEQARDCYQKAEQLWEKLRDAKQLTMAYAGKPEQLRQAAAAVASARR
jgi:hypothetical protein